METTKVTKVAEVRPLPRRDTTNRSVKQTPRILSQAKITSNESAAADQAQPMTINLNAGQVLLPLVGTATPQTAPPIVLRCTIPQTSLTTNSLSASTSPIASPSNIIIQQLTPQSSGSVSSIPNLQILQPLLQNIIQQNQSSNIAKVIIMPSAPKNPNTVNSIANPFQESAQNTNLSWQEPPAPILRIPGYDTAPSVGNLEASTTYKPAPTCTISKPPNENSLSNLTISNVFSLKDNAFGWNDDTMRENVIDENNDADLTSNDEDDDDGINDDDDVASDDSNLMRGDGHQVKAARRAAACMKRATRKRPADYDSYFTQGQFQMRISDDVEVYETAPEVVTDLELGKYKPKSNSTSKILFTSDAIRTHLSKSQNTSSKQTSRPIINPSILKIPRIAPKPKETPIIISSPTASRNVDDYIVPLAKCIPKNPDGEVDLQIESSEIQQYRGNETNTAEKKKTKVKVPQWKVGYVRRRKKKRSAATVASKTNQGTATPVTTSASQSPIAQVTNELQISEKMQKASAGYSTIRSLLNAPVGQMVTRRSRAASQPDQEDIIEIDDENSEDSLGNPSSPDPNGSGAKEQLRLMLLTKNKDKQEDDVIDEDDMEVDEITQNLEETGENENADIRKSNNKSTSRKGRKKSKRGKSGKVASDDEFRSDDEMPVLEKVSNQANSDIGGDDNQSIIPGVTEECNPKTKKSLKVKLRLKSTKGKGKRGGKSKRKGKVESWNIATEFENETVTGNDDASGDAKEEEIPETEIQETPKSLKQLVADNNPDDVVTSGAEEDETVNVDDEIDKTDTNVGKKKAKSHKHKRKSKRKKRKKQEESVTEEPEIKSATKSLEAASSNEHKILHLKEVLRQQQKQLDQLRHRNQDKNDV